MAIFIFANLLAQEPHEVIRDYCTARLVWQYLLPKSYTSPDLPVLIHSRFHLLIIC